MLFDFLLDPDPGKSSGSMRIQICNAGTVSAIFYFIVQYNPTVHTVQNLKD